MLVFGVALALWATFTIVSLAAMGGRARSDSRAFVILTGLSALPAFFLASVLFLAPLPSIGFDAIGISFVILFGWLLIGLPFGAGASAALYVWARQNGKGAVRLVGERKIVHFSIGVFVVGFIGPFILLLLGSAFNPWR